MDVYSITALTIRLFLSLIFFQKGKLALSGRTRTVANSIKLLTALSLFLGFYVYLFTLILLVMLGLKMWGERKGGWRWGKEALVFALTLIIFFKGPGVISLDKLLGNI